MASGTPIQKRKWKNSGADCCCPFTACLQSWFCPCFIYGKTRHIVKNNGDMQGYSAFNSDCMGFCGLTCLGIGFVLPMISRGDMRAKYKLTGDGCTDCLCACCCSPCDLTQTYKEAKDRAGEAKPLQQQQYQSANGMAYEKQPQAPAMPPQYQQHPQGHMHDPQQPQGGYQHVMGTGHLGI